jgi:tetratricopeptide (TPR) repeat protein
MRATAKSLMTALVVSMGLNLAYAPAVLASAPPAIERPSDQRSNAAALERERRYAGLSLTDAIRQSLIEDDLDFTFTTMSALGSSAGDGAGARYFSGVRAFARGDFAQAADLLKADESRDLLVASVRSWALAAQSKPAEAAASWDAYGDSGQRPFYATYRALLAEQAGQNEIALRNYRIAHSTGELLFAKDLAKRYAVLMVKAGKERDALTMFDAVFGETKALDAGDTAFRQSLAAKRPIEQAIITPHSAVSGLMSNFTAAGMLVRMMRPEPATPGAPTPPKPINAPDTDGLFISDALTLRTALLVDPSNINARFTLTNLLASLDEDEAALKSILPVNSGPRVNDARMILARIYASLENPIRALETMDAIPQSARDADWWDRRSDLLIARGQYGAALIAAQQSVALARGKGEWAENLAQLSLANALSFVGKSDEALTIAQRLVATIEKKSPLRGAAASFLIRNDATRGEGQQAARDSLLGFGADGRNKVSVGSLLARDPVTRAEGIALVREGAAEFSRSAMMMNSLGYNLIAYDVDLEEGYRLLQRAYEARPNSGAIMDSFGRANYKLGNFEEAARLIEGAVALRLDSPDPEIYDNLGDVYWHQGRKDDARVQWRKAKALGGAYEHGPQLDEKIRDGLTTPPPTRRDIPVVAEPGSV